MEELESEGKESIESDEADFPSALRGGLVFSFIGDERDEVLPDEMLKREGCLEMEKCSSAGKSCGIPATDAAAVKAAVVAVAVWCVSVLSAGVPIPSTSGRYSMGDPRAELQIVSQPKEKPDPKEGSESTGNVGDESKADFLCEPRVDPRGSSFVSRLSLALRSTTGEGGAQRMGE